MLKDINMNSIVKINNGKSMDMVEFADKFGLDLMNTETIIKMANILQRRGQLIVVEKQTKEEQLIADAQKENDFQEVVQGIQNEKQNAINDIREQQKEEVDTINMKLDYTSTLEAQKMAKWIMTELHVPENDISIVMQSSLIALQITNITPQEFNKISTKYNAQKLIDKTVNIADKGVNSTTNSINYLAEEVVAPVSKIAVAGAMNVSKGLFHTGIKILGSVINSGAKAIAETKYEMATDPELLQAQSQIINAKNAIKRGVNSKINNTSSGSGISTF